MKKDKKCGMTAECWSGFACLLGVCFIIIATILTLMTMRVTILKTDNKSQIQKHVAL